MNDDIFISIDVETFGPCPGQHPMVQLGAAAFNIDGKVIGTWEANLREDIWKCDPETMDWWDKSANRQAFQSLFENVRHPGDVMPDFLDWVRITCLGKQPVVVAYPAGFDFSFLHFYLLYYAGTLRPLSFSCIDIKTYVMAALKNTSYRQTVKKKFPREWFHPNLKHTHNAFDDALEQGFMFIQAHRQNLGLNLLNAEDFDYD